jgi:hypothetical protein
MAKKKSKLKKALKNALLLGGAVLGGRALMNRNARGSTNANAIKAMTSNNAYLDDSMPSNLSRNMGMYGRDSILAKPGINRITDYYGDSLKKGGRVGCGKAKRGFGRAMKKGRK